MKPIRQGLAVIPDSLRVLWRERRLWPAALAVTWAGTLAEVTLLRQSVDFGEPGLPVRLWQAFVGSGLLSRRGLAAFVSLLRQNPLAVAKIAMVWGVIAAVLMALTWLAVAGQGMLVYGAAYAVSGRPVPRAAGWAEGRKRWWVLLGLNVVAKAVVVAAMAALVALATFPRPVFVAAFICVGVVVFAAMAWLKLAAAAAVLERCAFGAAARRGLQRMVRERVSTLPLVAGLGVTTLTLFSLMIVAALLALMPFLLVLGVAELLRFTAGARVYVVVMWAVMVMIVAFGALLVSGVHWIAWTAFYARAADGRQRDASR